MPTRSKGLLNMTDITDMTEAELEKEFREEEVEEEEEVEAAGERGQGRASTTPSTDRPSSSDSFKTTSANSSDLHSDEAGGGSSDQSTMPDRDEKKQKAHGSSVWQSFKKAGGELNQDTRRMFRYIGRKLYSRNGQRETKVKEIHILPGEEDDRMWARRMAGSAHSRSSSGSDPST